ncbi:hypothetical protein RCH33_1980 [Flavobacterium daejeonense]|nr:hypothetical protein RCH33_1980 [Flavobacterium daejeonense]
MIFRLIVVIVAFEKNKPSQNSTLRRLVRLKKIIANSFL